MQKLSFLDESTLSPRKEMLAYETLWAIENNVNDFKESNLRELFNQYTPTESLIQLSDQLVSYNCSYDDVQNKVQSYLNRSLINEINRFSIMVNKSFQYPESLLKNYPIGLFYYKGNLDILDSSNEKCVSVVGTRTASSEGVSKARELSKELVKEGYVIVSGLAKGIDTAAHQSAIENKGYTIGVIGTPINECYPKENEKLQNNIAEDFLLISQVPFYKYANEPFNNRRFHFPRRNKTMASISKATVIVEASDASGSLVQARECLKQNKKLFIMDSCFQQKQIKWPENFEKKGAIRIKNTSDILHHLQ